MASTRITEISDLRPGWAVFVDLPHDDEPIVGRIIEGDAESFDLEVTDRGSNMHGERLTIFRGEIRSGGARLLRLC